MNVEAVEVDRPFVLDRVREGKLDYLDAIAEVDDAAFFRFIQATNILQELAQTYPSPRKKEEVPVWMYVASNLAMRFHGVHGFRGFPFIVRCGGWLSAFGPEVARKVVHPETGDVTMLCDGFNDKNDFDRQTPCDQDFLRKFARDSSVPALGVWFNRDFVRLLRQHKAFDEEGVYLGDGSYLFVPDNPEYEGSSRLLFDPNNHPVESANATGHLPPGYRWRRCYKLVMLAHTDRARSFLFATAVALLPGAASECPVLWDLVEGFVDAVGPGVMKRLILDRGFIDGAAIGRAKQIHGIDVLIPLKKKMQLTEDVEGLLRGGEVELRPYESPAPRSRLDGPPRVVPQRIRKREASRQRTLARRKEMEPSSPPPPKKQLVRQEIGVVRDLTWDLCPVPVNVVVNRELYADGHDETWLLLDLGDVADPADSRDDYRLRTGVEEAWRQFKCFWDLTKFSARVFSLVFGQVLFVLMTFTLLQLYFRRIQRSEFNRRSLGRIRDRLRPTRTVLVLYVDHRCAFLSPVEYTELLLTLSEDARPKILARVRKIERDLDNDFDLVRPP